jgi:hypothetical protein
MYCLALHGLEADVGWNHSVALGWVVCDDQKQQLSWFIQRYRDRVRVRHSLEVLPLVARLKMAPNHSPALDSLA